MGRCLQVSWQGVQNPTAADAVALLLAGSNLKLSVPLKYKWASSNNPDYLHTGSGSAEYACLQVDFIASPA